MYVFSNVYTGIPKKKKKIIGTLDIGYGDENILKEDAEKK